MTEEDEEDEDEGECAKFTWFNDTSIFNTDTSMWDSPQISLVNCPVPCAAHSAGVWGDKMVVFGGKDCKARNQNLHVLDLVTLEWSLFEDAGARPLPSSFHSAVQYRQFLVVIGGRLNDNSHSNSLNVLGN